MPHPGSLCPPRVRRLPPHGRGTRGSEDISSGQRFSSHLLLPAAQQAAPSRAQGETGVQKEGGQLRLHSPPAGQRSGGRACVQVCVRVHVCAKRVHVCARTCVCLAHVLTGAGLGWGEGGPEARKHAVVGAAARSPARGSRRGSSPRKAAERDLSLPVRTRGAARACPDLRVGRVARNRL